MERDGFRRAWIRAVSVMALRNRALPAVAMLLFSSFCLYWQLDLPVGPMGEIAGVIESSGGLAGAFGTTTIIATARLGDGSRIQARVQRGVADYRDQRAFVRVYRDRLSGKPSYVLYRAVANSNGRGAANYQRRAAAARFDKA